MATYEQDQIIREYWNKVKEKYPDVEFDRFKAVCKAPFEFIKYCMKRLDLPHLMIKHFGKILIYPGTVREQIRKNEIFYKKGFMVYDDYVKRQNKLRAYLKILEDDQQVKNAKKQTTD